MIKAGYYEDVITVEDGLLFRTVVAHWAATRRRDGGCYAVYRIDENGKEYCRALMYNMYCGYYIDEDDLKKRKWYDVYSSLDHFKLGHYDQLRSFGKTDAERICSVHPDFKYVVQKAGEMPVAKMFNILIAWKKNHNVELLVGANLDYLALNKSFAKLTKPKQKAVLNFIRGNSEAFVNKWSLAKINFVMNKKGSPRTSTHGRSSGHSARWSITGGSRNTGRNRDKYILYRDYTRMAEYCGHDMKEDYWKYPKSIKKAHDKVMKQYGLVIEAEAIAAKKARAREGKGRKNAISRSSPANFAKASRRLAGWWPTFPRPSARSRITRKPCINVSRMPTTRARWQSVTVCLSSFPMSRANPSRRQKLRLTANVVQFYADEDREEKPRT